MSDIYDSDNTASHFVPRSDRLIGNSSLCGAYAMLLSTKAEKKVYELAQNMTYLELSTEPGYMDEFVACCFLPHTDSSLFPTVMSQV